MKQCAILLLATACAALADDLPVKVSVLENTVLCVRTSRVTDRFSEQFHAVQPTNVLSGIILDLRSADGDRNVATNDFASRKTPLVILVNGQTRGAAAALAAELRAAGPGVIVIGSTNAAQTIRPDLTVSISADDEQRFLEDPYFTPDTPLAKPAGTNDFLSFVDHISEADLVRIKMKDGEDNAKASALPRPAPAQPVIRDPALARAMDLLKALAARYPAQG